MPKAETSLVLNFVALLQNLLSNLQIKRGLLICFFEFYNTHKNSCICNILIDAQFTTFEVRQI